MVTVEYMLLWFAFAMIMVVDVITMIKALRGLMMCNLPMEFT
jgi:hypothetical protein